MKNEKEMVIILRHLVGYSIVAGMMFTSAIHSLVDGNWIFAFIFSIFLYFDVFQTLKNYDGVNEKLKEIGGNEYD